MVTPSTSRFRALVLSLLAVPLAGCPAPMYQALIAPDATPAEARGRFVDVDAECGMAYGYGSCEPDEFAAVVDDLGPARIVGHTWGGDRVRGRSIVLRSDTARIGRAAVPLADLERIELVEPASAGVLATLATMPVTAAGIGALGGLGEGRAAIGERAAIGAGLGLALAVLARPRDWGHRFEVVGWAPPPRPDNRLDADGDGCASEWYPPRVFSWEPDCLAPEEVEARATASWVRQVDLVLLDGTRIEGATLAMGPTAAALDGRAVSYGDLARIELRHPRPLAPLVTTAKGAFEGGLMGAAVGSGVALAEGDPGAVWQGAVIGAAVIGAGGLLLGLIRPSDTARDVFVLPEP